MTAIYSVIFAYTHKYALKVHNSISFPLLIVTNINV